jgi:multidrug efflux system outer membrane protein
MRIGPLSIGIVILVCGCSLAPEYNRPPAPVPAAWPTGPAYQKSSVEAGQPAVEEVPWRKFFTDRRLQQLIEMALVNNRDLRLTALNVEKARAFYGIRRAELFPAVDAAAYGTKYRTPADLSSSGRAKISERYDVNLGIVAWEIDFFGRIRSLKDSALEQFLATEQARRAVQILIVSEVAKVYLALAADSQNLTLANTTLEAQKETYYIVKRRFEVGIATELDLRRSQTQVDGARRDVSRFTQLMAQDLNALNLLIGSSTPVSDDLLPVALSAIEPLKSISAGISSEVLLRRPDILQAEHLLKAANANIGAARAALFPRISLTTTYGTASSELSGLFKSGSLAWGFAPDITLPIFDARLWSALDATKAEREITLVEYEKAIETAFREVADALAVSGTVEEQLAAQRAFVEAARETFRLSGLRYDKGVDSYLSVLDAQRSLYLAERVLVGLNLEKHLNQVQLYAVLGGGAE